jgi:hypothetical protein
MMSWRGPNLQVRLVMVYQTWSSRYGSSRCKNHRDWILVTSKSGHLDWTEFGQSGALGELSVELQTLRP